MENIVKIFVGCSANGEDIESQAVLEYSLRKYSSLPIEITWMKLSNDPKSFWYSKNGGVEGWKTHKWITPFHGFRFGIPAACNFNGQAIYMDSDMIVMSDIAELWKQPFEENKIMMAKGGKHARICVIKFDCAAAKKLDLLTQIEKLKSSEDSFDIPYKFFCEHPEYVQNFVGNWNCVDGDNYVNLRDPEIKLHHYSSMSHQPHLAFALPRLKQQGKQHWFNGIVRKHWRKELIKIFNEFFAEAKLNGYSPEKYIPEIEYGKYQIRSFKNQVHGNEVYAKHDKFRRFRDRVINKIKRTLG